MQNTTKSQAGSRQAERTDSMIAVSASKLATADLNNLMRALEIDVVALTEMLIPSGYRAEMGTIDAPAIHYTISGRGRISIGEGPWMSLVRGCDQASAALIDRVAHSEGEYAGDECRYRPCHGFSKPIL